MRTLSWRRLFSGRNGVALLSGCFGILLSGCAGQDCSMVREDGMTLQLIPMADNAIRVKLTAPDGPQLEEIVFTQKTRRPKSQTECTDSTLKLSVAQLSATYSIAEDKITFRNAEGKVLLQESAHSREITAVDVMGQKAYQVTQSFISPVSEHLYGTGQFQDGYTDIRGLQRRLTQVNTQIALPMVISNKGYGLLWHNYSKTDFNPADASVALQRDELPETSVTVNATSTHGNVRERRVFNSYSATINVPEAGTYSILLDVGQAMARKHDLSIDGEKVITMQNTWLPPTASTFVELSAGEHVLQSECSFGDKPTVYYNKVQNLTTLRSEAAPGLDYTVFAGGADQVISSFRKLSGPVPEMPDWMFGYIHCRERYNTQDELLANATEFRKRQIPVDVIVQDWQWWGKYGWNAMQFDEDRYPDPKAMTDSLHAMDIKLMLSVWSKIDQNCEVGKQMKEAGYYVPGTDWIDFFNPEASAAY
ncbi:MAG: hypothetical protein MJY79_08720 [Bacteroidaceae bacterium]|nr:hypothetical protein [Bacteroidaceae bacterium]